MKLPLRLPASVRGVALAHLLVAGATLLLYFVPLFDLVGFEFAAAIGALLAYVTGWRAAGAAARARAALRGGEAQAPFPGAALRRVTLENLTLLVTPLALMALHAWRVPVCNWSQGLAFYGLLPIPGALYGTGLGFALGLVWEARRARVFFILWSLLSFALTIWRLVAEPPKFAFNAFIGYFPGPVYDAAVPVTTALVVARTTVVCEALLFVLVATLAWDGHRSSFGALRRSASDERFVLRAVALVLATGLLAVQLFAAPLGLSISRRDIQRALGGHLETPHVHLYYDRTSLTAERAARLAQQHEWRYAQLERFFGQAPPRKIGSYVYGSPAQKKGLMGAAGTSFEDALHDEFHINDSRDDPHPVLTHEMAHIFAAHIDRWVPICWKIGIHEGIAVAAEWSEESGRLELTPHQASAAMDSLGILPDLERSLSAYGFWTQPGARAYTACGSFVRYLLDTYGMTRFRVLWRRGDFEAAYGKPLRTLLTEWHALLEATPIGAFELRRAERLFRPPAVFSQPCAHELARLEADAAAAFAAGDVAAAESLYARLAEIDPDDPDHAYQLYRSRMRDRRQLDAAARLSRELHSAAAHASQSDRMWRLAADAAWLAGDFEAARRALDRAADLGASESDARAIEVMLAAFGDPRLRDLLRDYLVDSGLSETAALALLVQARLAAPETVLPRYLLGRRLYFAEQWDAAVAELESALAAGTLGPLASRAARELLGRAHWAAGRPEAGREVFDGLLATPLPEPLRLRIEDWKWRCDFDLSLRPPKSAASK